MTRRILSIGIIVLSSAPESPNDMKNINDFLKAQVDAHHTPSVQYAFFDTDSVIYEISHGVKNVRRPEVADRSTTYHLFSVTKTFTALAVLQLAQTGRVCLSDPVTTYLTDFPYDPTITIEQLLSHTSGIPNPIPLRWIHTEAGHESFRSDEFFKKIFADNLKLDFSPGSQFKYSNLGYVILGQLIEKVTGEKFEAYIDQHIIVPCGAGAENLHFHLNHSTDAVGYHKWLTLSNAALGFLIDKSKFMGPREGKWKPFKPFYNNGAPYGGLMGTRDGLVKYAQALLKHDSPIIDPKYRKLLFTECVINGKGTGMSYSWFTGSLNGNPYFAHAGGGGGFYVELRVYPDLGVGSVILYNRSGMRDERMLDKVDRFFITSRN